MHQQIRESLEVWLKGKDCLKGSAPDIPSEFHKHLGECQECANELRSLEVQSELLRSLRSPQGMEPRAGFYARVLERIEARPASVWSVFLDRKFGLRLAVASASLIALLGIYLVTSEPSGPEFGSTPAVISTDIPVAQEANPPEDGLRQQQQRNEVLVDLASYHQ
jgi:anti-sigma factor RsiW